MKSYLAFYARPIILKVTKAKHMVRLRGSIEKSIKEAEARLVYQCALRAKRDGDVFELWYNPKRNGETTEIVGLLKEIERQYFVRYIDATKSSMEQRKKFYYDIILQPWKRRRRNYFVAYPMRVTPGAPKDYDFRLRRPCLIIYANNRVIDIYPHQEKVSIPSAEEGKITLPKIKLMITALRFLREFRARFSERKTVNKEQSS